MPKESDLEESKVSGTEDKQEILTEDTSKGLSLRDALEVAVIGTKEPKADEIRDDIQTKAETEADDRGGIPKASTEPPLEPPAEYTNEEKEDFRQLSRKGQEAQLRLDRSRKAKIEEIKAATREYEGLKRLSDDVNPYLKALGVKESTPVAIQKALKMWREFEEGDPKVAAAAYLKAKGLPIPKELTEGNSEKEGLNQHLLPLQEEVKSIKMKLAQEEKAKFGSILNQAWQSFEQEKNAAGKPKFPSIDSSEQGLRLASSIGSLVSGETELSKQFIADAKTRIPNLTYEALIKEAYRFYGGKVDDSEAPRSQDSQKHIVKSRRAASSVPGRGAQTTSSGPVKKFKTWREAAEAALADLNSE